MANSGILLDTNIVSELIRPRPDQAIADWIDRQEEDLTFLSVATLAELRDGIERLPAGARRQALDRWLTEDLLPRFERRILGVDAPIADAWGRMLARGRRQGRPLGSMDALLAATAHAHDLTLATRNTSDFASLGLNLVDPWKKD